MFPETRLGFNIFEEEEYTSLMHSQVVTIYICNANGQSLLTTLELSNAGVKEEL